MTAVDLMNFLLDVVSFIFLKVYWKKEEKNCRYTEGGIIRIEAVSKEKMKINFSSKILFRFGLNFPKVLNFRKVIKRKTKEYSE